MSLSKETVAVSYHLEFVDGVLCYGRKATEDLFIDDDTLAIEGRSNYKENELSDEDLENIQLLLDYQGHFHEVEVEYEYFPEAEEGYSGECLLSEDDYSVSEGAGYGDPDDSTIDQAIEEAVKLAEQIILENQGAEESPTETSEPIPDNIIPESGVPAVEPSVPEEAPAEPEAVPTDTDPEALSETAEGDIPIAAEPAIEQADEAPIGEPEPIDYIPPYLETGEEDVTKEEILEVYGAFAPQANPEELDHEVESKIERDLLGNVVEESLPAQEQVVHDDPDQELHPASLYDQPLIKKRKTRKTAEETDKA